MRKIRVMAMISNLNDGGAQRVLINNLIGLKNDCDIEFTVYVYEMPQGSVYDKIVKSQELNVQYLNKKRHSINFPVIGDIFNFFITNHAWRLAIKEYKPDIIHTHVTEVLRKCFLGIWFSKGIIKFSTLHSNPYRYRGLALVIAKCCFNRLGFIPVCITEQQAEMAKEHYGIKKYELLRNGTDFTQMDQSLIDRKTARKLYGIPKDSFVIATVGRLTKIKNISFLLDVLKMVILEKNNTYLLLAGDGEERDKLEEKAKKFQIEDKVIFLGNITDVKSVYVCADVLCMPSISEASPMAFHEAQHCGLKCIISDGVPAENIFSNNVFRVNGFSVEKWKNEILSLGEGSSMRPTLTEEDFSIETSTQNLRQMYIKYFYSKKDNS